MKGGGISGISGKLQNRKIENRKFEKSDL